MLSKYVRKDDCGCGGGKNNCVTKNTFAKWLQAELKRLDCGCGCKGKKGFQKKYGLVGGKILADCPPGWRNDGLTCVENCNADEFDDGLTCRKKCPPGQIDDGLTCRNPIKSEMTPCPDGSKDIAGTCWGPVRKDCIDDCFKHPAPGCRTYECGRLRGAFGEDWGPRWCTDCNLRCGQTCWDVQGITRQLHERNLRVFGGEVFGQQIRGKQIRGRVNFDELLREIDKGITDLFEGRIDLAAAFDPERNGVAAAFRKFGDDIKKVLEDVGNRIKEGFEKMAAETKKAFEDFARDAETKFKQFGEDFVNKMKDPDFWVEAIGIMAQIAAAAVSIAITVGTLGAGTGLAVGLMAAAQMAGPAAKMIADAARGRPIDVLDIATLAISAATAVVPGMSASVGAMVKAGANAASFTIKAVQVGQGLGVIPSTCIANCPKPPPPDKDEVDPPLPPPDDPPPPPPGQKSDAEILALQPEDTKKRVLRGPPRIIRAYPEYMTEAQWIAKYRADNYGTVDAEQNVETPSGAIADKKDVDTERAADVKTDTTQLDITNIEVPSGGEPLPDGEIDFGEPAGEIDFGEPAGEIDFGEPTGEIDFGEPADEIDFGIGAGKKRRKRRGGELGPIIEAVTIDGVLTNPGGKIVSLPGKANIPKDHTGAEFNFECYARKNPELAAAVGNDKEKLITHWLEIGSKEGWDASCGAASSKEERLKAVEELSKREALKDGLKTACKAVDNFWVESTLECDGMRHADGRENTKASKCRQEGSHWNTTGKNYCNKWRNTDNNIKSPKERCNTINGHWANNTCDLSKNVDGTTKIFSDFCVGFDNYYDTKKQLCVRTKDRDGRPKTQEQMCLEDGTYFDGFRCDRQRYPDGTFKGKQALCQTVLHGTLRDNQYCDNMLGLYPLNTSQMFDVLRNKKLIDPREEEWIQPFIPPDGKTADLIYFKGNGKPQKSLTLYYADWCPHCHDMMPEWKKLGKTHKGIKIQTIEQKQSKRKDITGFPTIMFSDGQRETKYEGPRTKSGFVKFLKNNL